MFVTLFAVIRCLRVTQVMFISICSPKESIFQVELAIFFGIKGILLDLFGLKDPGKCRRLSLAMLCGNRAKTIMMQK